MASSVEQIRDVLTLGLEEEFVLVDGREPVTVPRAEAVLARIGGRLDGRMHRELFQTQIETNTLPRVTAAELRADLAETRGAAIEAAAGLDTRLVASGAGVLSRRPLPVTQSPRYLEIARRFPDVLAEFESEPSGCHIHLGTLDRDRAVLLGTRLRPWMPLLQSLAGNSPFAAGRDRGCASWRYFEFQHWPSAGPAPSLTGGGYERAVRRLMESGTVMDRKMIYWFTRPSERWPTLEIRVADVNPDLNVPVLLALLVRGLAATILAALQADQPVPGTDEHRLIEDHRLAARFGLAAEGLDPVSGTLASAEERAASLLEFSRPGLEPGGDLETAALLLAEVRATGGGAAQQRADFQVRGSLSDVVDGLVKRTAV
ncbi:glutamate--cysteine ligase GCS2 [Catenulispora acidiphila DSM 44928]|uniref:Putative glutamate--cysteine ligase 2 n=1 Tax=Catenulispora acidiphila (strain DSM 44928 / JCM 14897 / NBRC 102108 / NRRL B-24433 / ID139908) TaxID=479433 RepID=C7PYE4_CATAD|nr:YbdK family carboxylate-amine ligase [Catenulispora acidiphila]ACU75434.1 glutamate--cysteine ligase GCS2 [Catenulispora acidiphila DSM 44928]